MKSIRAFIKSHPLLSYFALAFAISWGGVLFVVGSGGIPGTREQFQTMVPFVGLAMLAGPPIAGILMTGVLYGRAGLRELLSRSLRWRVGARWYAVALLTAPLLMMTAAPLALWLLFPASLTTANITLVPLATGVALLTWSFVLAAALWVVVGAVAVANGGRLSRQPPLRGRVA